MLRILLFSPKGCGLHYYGPGMNAYRMYQHLQKGNNLSLTLVHGNKEQEEYDIFDHQYFISDIVNKDLILGVSFLMKAKKWIKENAHRFDVVHCLTAFHHSFMFAYWFEQEGVPAIIKIGQSDYTGFNENSVYSKLLGLNRFRILHANEITGYISISNAIREKLVQAGIHPERIYDIPNGVDTDKFFPADTKMKKELRLKLGIADKFTIIFTGAFSSRKNPFILLKAFEKLKNKEDVQLLLIGPDTDNGKERKLITDFIEQKKIKDVYVFDFIKKIVPYYQASDLFVLPSNQEGFSNSMLEAQACGLPAVVTRISGSEELIDQNNGIFVKIDDVSIYNAMKEYVYNEKKLRDHSAAAREKVIEKYSSKRILNEYVGLFQKVKKSE